MARWSIILVAALSLGNRVVAEPIPPLAVQAQTILRVHCLRCHANANTDYFDARSRSSLTARGEGQDRPYITPGKLDESLLWDYVKDRAASMPKSGEERRKFSDAQRAILKAWILAGAPDFPTEPPREFLTLETILGAIWDHANKSPAADVKHLRYFTLTHLHNNNAHIRAADLRGTRAALAKALNSLTWMQGIVLPEVVPGTEGTVLVVHLQKLGWSPEVWNRITRAYPYNLGFANHDNERLRELDVKLRKLYDDRVDLIHVRADWFVATATRPPLYHQILYETKLPALIQRADDPGTPDNPRQMTAHDLEDFLRVDVVANLLAQRPEIMRAGFPTSGVSNNNRLIERHPLGQGAYWKSYDFRSSTWEGNLQQFPLGPVFDRNPYPRLAFKHDGGEIIFHLPNGMQGYLLVDGQDRRIDKGPIEVVSDPAGFSGTPVVVNGISCMACHKNGMRPAPADQIRTGKGILGEARERVKLLYPERAELNRAIERDQQLFLASLERAIGPYLRQDSVSKTLPITELPEPVSETARTYYAVRDDLDAVTVASELYLPSAREVVRKANSGVWRQLGLGALALEGGRIKRGAWESIRGTSQMQQAAREFGYSPR